MKQQNSPFWEQKSLFDMTTEEWESVCDGCGKCCLMQLQDEVTDELVFTDVACDLLDDDRCRCTQYERRSELVPECMVMNKENLSDCMQFAPDSCSYRTLYNGQKLPSWHHLVSGDRGAVLEQGKSVKGRVRRQADIDMNEIESFVVEWPDS